jgi:2,4-didehydro-3-deoxy-L-rhamnonate hydrolase
MRILNVAGRACVQVGALAVDIAEASEHRFSPDLMDLYDQWEEFLGWAEATDLTAHVGQPCAPSSLGAPVPRPRQIFAIGLNYAEHADESGFVKPDRPVVFTKFASSLTGPVSTVTLPPGSVDWEVELVAVIGRGGRAIGPGDGWSHVAGLMVGQDLSERESQHHGPAPQFSLAKSFKGFSPTGPSLVTPDELENRDDLVLGAEIDGVQVQRGRTAQMIFSVPELVEYLSSVAELYPGDLLFTGTPAGIGAGRIPPRFLKDGELLLSYVEGIGELRQTVVDPGARAGAGLAAAQPQEVSTFR